MSVGPKVGTVLRYQDKGISVEEARKAMLEAGQAPKGLLGETKKNEAVVPVVAPPPTPTVKPATSAKFTEINEDGSAVGEPQIYKAATPQELDGVIRKAHARAFVSGKKLKVEFISDEPEEQPAVSVPAEPPVAAAPPSLATTTEAPEKIETNRYVAAIRQEDGKWVGEIVYKVGGGTERFEAPSRALLMMKFLEGKANATLRVREAVRREKYGVELDKVYELPDGLTTEKFNEMPEEARFAVIDSVAMKEALVFQEKYPEYYGTAENSEKIQRFLNNYKHDSGRGLPYTARNLAFAFEELIDANELTLRPSQRKEVVIPVSAPAAPPVDSGASVVPAAPATPVATAPATPVVEIRKRGTTGLQPSHSSSTPIEPSDEESRTPREPSAAELRKSSPIGQPPSKELREQYRATLAKKRQF